MSKFVLEPAVFFYAQSKLLFHHCSINDGEDNGLFVNYPHSHIMIWRKYYERFLHVDFDYYPRGRILYHKADDTYLVYCDCCIRGEMESFLTSQSKTNYILCVDEHYQCNRCNPDYVE